MTIDGRSVRAKNIYDDIHKKLVNSAIELFNNPDIENEKINISMIAKNAGTSVATGYNHFPDNLIDVFGSIFTIGFNNVVESLQKFTETHSDPYEQLNAYINIQTQTAIHLGNALREAFYQFRELLNLGFTDVYRYINRNKQEFTFWDYTSGSWQKNNGLRIDHFLVSNNILKNVQNIFINKKPRSKMKPSDHTPIELDIN